MISFVIRKSFKVGLGLFFSWLLLFTHFAFANTEPILEAKSLGVDVDRIKEITAIAMSPDGYIDKEMHGEFWKAIPESLRSKKFLSSIDVRESIAFQREFWASIKLSYLKNKITKTKNYLKMVEERKGKGYAIKNIESQNKMFDSAAHHRSFKSSTGTSVEVTADVATKILNGLPAIEKRLDQLYNPVWQP